MTPTRIIAEAAQGYEGKPDYCYLYVRAAAKAGATAVKFQIVYADDLAEPGYQYYDLYKTLEMDVAVWQQARDLASELGILFFADVFGDRSMRVAETIALDGLKIHSSDFFNRALIVRAFDAAERVFVSLGGIEEDEIRAFVEQASGWGVTDRLTLLCGFQAEPTPTDKSGLNRVPLLNEWFPDIEIGFMDHAPGESDDQVHVSLVAMALGADWIEKHITLSRYLEIEDFVSALEPDEFGRYVTTLERLAEALGPADLELNDLEQDYRETSVKKLVAAKNLASGHALSIEDLAFKRLPRNAAHRAYHDPARTLGKALRDPIKAGEPILEGSLK